MSAAEEDGTQTFEEILASIRRSIETASSAHPVERTPSLGSDTADDDFKLPAVFRTPHQSETDRRVMPSLSSGQVNDQRLGSAARGDRHVMLSESSPGQEGGPQSAQSPLREKTAEGPADAAVAETSLQARLASAIPRVPDSAGSQLNDNPSFRGSGLGKKKEITPEASSVVKLYASSSAPPQDAAIPRIMASCRDTLVIRMSEAQIGPGANDEENSSSSIQGGETNHRYGPIIPFEHRAVELHALDPARDGAPTASATGLDAADRILEGQEIQWSANIVVTATGTLDQSTVAALRPVLREWLASSIGPLVKEAVRAEMDSTKSG